MLELIIKYNLLQFFRWYKMIYNICGMKRGDNMNLPVLPSDVDYILNTLNSKGYEAYIVGGCVRDCILGRQAKDWDITTSAEPIEVKKCFSKTFDTGIKHGTVTVVLNKENYEVTTYRIEGKYEDCRHPEEVSFTKNINEDLLRRDFTMNAIAYHPQKGFIDPYKGIFDIQCKIIRGVGNPSKRFQEDALRMLRAVRFSAQLGFQIEDETYQAVVENNVLIKKVSAERIKEELQKLLLSDSVEKLPTLWTTGLLSNISSVLYMVLPTQEQELVRQLKAIEKEVDLVWAVFLQYIALEETEKLLKQLKFDTKTLKNILILERNLKIQIGMDEYCVRKKAFEIGVDELKQLIKLKRVQSKYEDMNKFEKIFEGILERNDPIRLKDLAINGNDLMDLGVGMGKMMGDMLYYALDIVHRDIENNEKQILMKAIREHFLV